MKIQFAEPVPSRFDALMYNDAFTLEKECKTIFIRTQNVYGKATKTCRVNAMQLGITDNAREPLRHFSPDTEVYQVTITDITIVVGR